MFTPLFGYPSWSIPTLFGHPPKRKWTCTATWESRLSKFYKVCCIISVICLGRSICFSLQECTLSWWNCGCQVCYFVSCFPSVKYVGYRRGSPLLIGIRSDSHLIMDNIPVIFNSIKGKYTWLGVRKRTDYPYSTVDPRISELCSSEHPDLQTAVIISRLGNGHHLHNHQLKLYSIFCRTEQGFSVFRYARVYCTALHLYTTPGQINCKSMRAKTNKEK